MKHLEDSGEASGNIFATFIVTTIAAVFLWKEGVLAMAISHFISFIPAQYFSRFLAFPSLALLAFEKDTGGSVVQGSPLVQVCETIMLLQVWQLSFSYLFSIIRFTTGHKMASFGGSKAASDDGLLHDIITTWVALAFKAYVLGFLPDTRKEDAAFHHNVVLLHNFIVIVNAFQAFGAAFAGSQFPVFVAVFTAVDNVQRGANQVTEVVRQALSGGFNRLKAAVGGLAA